MPILSAGLLLKFLSTVSATTDSYGAGESKVGAGEREGTGDGVEQKCTRAETGSMSH